ncbi:MAG: JAB domain-containing protein [Kiritimatiellae bacterium]|nr:JAB domain-containing protein [Kiritimatiellia bacterium]
MLGIKRVENRNVLPVPSKGRCAISCSKSFTKEEYGEFVRWAALNLSPDEFETIPAWNEVKDWAGKIVGTCNYSSRFRNDLVLNESGEHNGKITWDEGYEYWWDLSEVACFDHPIPCRGNVGMWQLPSALVVQVSAADFLSQQIGERIASTEDAAKIFRATLPIVRESEGFFVLPLDENRRVLAEPVLVSLGTSSVTTTVQPNEVFCAALTAGAKSIIVAHNHPSGNLTPSVQDRQLTTVLASLGEQLGVKLLDHIVLGCGTEYSSIGMTAR